MRSFNDELCIRRVEAYTNGSTTLHLQTQSESRFLFVRFKQNKMRCVNAVALRYLRTISTLPHQRWLAASVHRTGMRRARGYPVFCASRPLPL